mmetsp:Transcript_14609/g.26418  ORF Transcript_14609/g.26418 Transcript_14609/m.26418 type:complete len:93 (+) Transcript_14609:140-418(+)
MHRSQCFIGLIVLQAWSVRWWALSFTGVCMVEVEVDDHSPRPYAHIGTLVSQQSRVYSSERKDGCKHTRVDYSATPGSQTAGHSFTHARNTK